MKALSILKNKTFLFVVSFILICFFYNYYHILQLRPRPNHQWRQTDCLSITSNYYYNGMNFFSPEVHNLISDGMTSGKSAGECPILYYLVAVLWKIFGIHEWIYRFVGLLFVFLGLFSLFKITENYLHDTFWSIAFPLILFTSPIFANYGVSFITNVPAICMVLLALWLFLRFYNTKKSKFLYLSMFMFLIAGLLKVSALIGFLFLLMIFLGERITFLNRKKIYIFGSWKHLIPFFLVVLIIFLWYYYAGIYNIIHGGKYTFNDLWPIWKLNKAEIIAHLVQIKNNAIYQFFNPFLLFSFILMFAVIILTPKKHRGFYYWGTIILFIGGIIYTLFWFQAFDVHDYYYIDLLIVAIFIPFVFLLFLKNHFDFVLQSRVVKIIYALFLFYNVLYCKTMLELRYFPVENKKYLIIESQDIIDSHKWLNWRYPQNIEAFENIEPYLRIIGIKPDDIVVSIPDPSINITLYLMNQKGFTDFEYSGFAENEKINYFVKAGAKYLIINDKSLLEQERMKPFLKKKIGAYRNVTIFDLRDLAGN